MASVMTKDSIMREKVVIIIPTYNEALNIEQTITNLLKESIYIMDFLVEILVFDSASTDHTAEIVKNLAKTNKSIHITGEPCKTGLGSSYIQAMTYAIETLHADIVFEYDADGSHQPHYIKPMLEKIR